MFAIVDMKRGLFYERSPSCMQFVCNLQVLHTCVPRLSLLSWAEVRVLWNGTSMHAQIPLIYL